MPSAENARLQIEAGQTLVAMAQLTDSGDHIKFTGVSGLWSGVAGKTPVIRPKSGANDQVTVAALEANLNGAIQSVAGADVSISRTAGGGTYQKHSIIVNNAGALAAVAGTEGGAFSTTRGAAGGPPFIPVDAVEVAQIWLTSDTAAPIQASEIKQVPGEHFERANFPLYTIDPYSGAVSFVSALPLSHTGSVPKRVYAEYYTPIFAPVPKARDVVLPERTFSINSEATYDGPEASASSALAQGSFTALLENGIDDLLVQLEGQNLWFKFYPDRYKSAYHAYRPPVSGCRQPQCVVHSHGGQAGHQRRGVNRGDCTWDSLTCTGCARPRGAGR